MRTKSAIFYAANEPIRVEEGGARPTAAPRGAGAGRGDGRLPQRLPRRGRTQRHALPLRDGTRGGGGRGGAGAGRERVRARRPRGVSRSGRCAAGASIAAAAAPTSATASWRRWGGAWTARPASTRSTGNRCCTGRRPSRSTPVVPEWELVKVTDAVPIERLASLGLRRDHGGRGRWCAPPRCGAGSTVAVWGCGGVGLNVVQGAAIAGARRIIAIDLAPAQAGVRDAVRCDRHDQLRRRWTPWRRYGS